MAEKRKPADAKWYHAALGAILLALIAGTANPWWITELKSLFGYDGNNSKSNETSSNRSPSSVAALLRVGAPGEQVDWLQSNGIDAQLDVKHGNIRASYRSNLANVDWGVWQIVNADRTLGGAKIQRLRAGWRPKDGSSDANYDSARLMCDPEAFDSLVDRFVQRLGQPNTFEPLRTDTSESINETGVKASEVRQLRVVAWSLDGGGKLALGYKSQETTYTAASDSLGPEGAFGCRVRICFDPSAARHACVEDV